MIEYKHHGALFNDRWFKITPPEVPVPADFEFVVYRINGVTYSEWNDEFIAAFQKERMWNTLKNGELNV